MIFDIPRSKSDYMEHLYPVLEQFKNGQFFSGKYESKARLFPKPHVIVFANFAPETDKLSMDRWDIIPLEPGIEVTRTEIRVDSKTDQIISEPCPKKRKNVM